MYWAKRKRNPEPNDYHFCHDNHHNCQNILHNHNKNPHLQVGKWHLGHSKHSQGPVGRGSYLHHYQNHLLICLLHLLRLLHFLHLLHLPNLIVRLSESYYYCSSVTLRGPPLSRERKELSETRWCQNDRIFKGFSVTCVGHTA